MKNGKPKLSVIWLDDPQRDPIGVRCIAQSLQASADAAGMAQEVLGVPRKVAGETEMALIARGLAKAKGELLLFVRQHVLLTAPCVQQLIRTIALEKSGGVAAPASSAGIFSTPDVSLTYQTRAELADFGERLAAGGLRSREALVLDSGCFLVRREALEAAGGFDPSFALTRFALADLCLRMRQAGWSAFFVPSAYVHEDSLPSYEADAADATKFRVKHGFDYRYSCNTRPELLKFVRLSAERPAVLEAGCACGGNLLRLRAARPDVELCGIELSEASAKVARQFAQVYALDVEDFSMPEWEGRFDAVICGDLLEHLRDPWTTMKRFCRITRPGGRIIISVPNVMHISNLAGMLLDGNWAYQDQGIRDRTHLRFFTKKTACELVKQGGYHVAAVEARVFAMPQELHELCDKLTPLLGADVGRRELEAYQWVVVGERS